MSKVLLYGTCEGCYNGREFCKIHGKKTVKGKWRHKEIRITYFCRNCWHHASFAVPVDVIEGKTMDDLRKLATDVHRANTDLACKNPDAVLCPTT